MATNREIAQMPIQQAVLQPGGNGLASPAFQIPLNILRIFGWHNIEQGVEACVCDGVLIPSTKIKAELERLIGRKSFVRRVLLKPAPLEISTTGLTRDQLQLTLSVAIKYEVQDPVYVASLSDPLAELKNFFIGKTAECLRSKTFDEFISDEGEVRIDLYHRFQDAFVFRGKYLISDILKVIPTGDERLVEIARQTRAAAEKAHLVKLEGQNREIDATYNLNIARNEAGLDEEIAQHKHEREKEIRQMEARADLMKTAIESIAEVSKLGVNPTPIVKDVLGLIDNMQHTQLASGANPALTASSSATPAAEEKQLAREKRALDSVKAQLGIVTYDITEQQSKIKDAVIQLHGYQIIIRCPDGYPEEPPLIEAHMADGSTQTFDEIWISGVNNNLAQVLSVIVHHIKPNIE
mgnify:CR=1 FL=1